MICKCLCFCVNLLGGSLPPEVTGWILEVCHAKKISGKIHNFLGARDDHGLYSLHYQVIIGSNNTALQENLPLERL